MIYQHNQVWFDSISFRISVGIPLEESDTTIPSIPEPTPKAVQAVVTRRCNLSCSYCNVKLSGDSLDDMSLEIARGVIDSAAQAPQGRLVMVTGGEPLLLQEITFYILENVAPPKVLFTNATLMTKKIAKELKRLQVSPVVSMDGSDIIHNTNRCNSWAAAAKGLDLLREEGVPYGISTVVSHHNYRDIESEMIKLKNRFQPVSMGFNILHWTHEGFNPISGEAYSEAMGHIFSVALETGIFVDQIARRIEPIITSRYKHRDCAALGGKLVFHPDGRVSNCISARENNDWSSWIPALMEYCSDCQASGICGGGCAWDSIHLGSNDRPDARHCMWVKHILDLFLEDVASNFPEGLVSREDLSNRYGSMITRAKSTLTSSLGH